MSDYDHDSMTRDRHRDLIEQLSERDEIETAQQSIGRLNETFDSDQLDDLPDDEILETAGLLSTVKDDSSEEIGHILMVEYDDIDDPFRPIKIAEQKPGISVVLRSSPGSYHVYNLSVRDRDTQLLDAVRADGDVWQARWAARRGYFVLRILPKIRAESREEYKAAPEIVKVLNSESEYPQSKPHLDLLLDRAESDSTLEPVADLRAAAETHELIGDGIEADHYQTVTDESKEVLDR